MMKKTRVLYLSTVFLMAMNCHNEPYEGDLPVEPDSCLLAMQATAEAFTDFSMSTEDSYSILCQIYRGALENQIEICGDEDGSLQVLVDGLSSCSNEDLCVEAIVATENARVDFENTTDDDFETLCNIYRDALIYQIEVCGDDGTLESIIEELGNCQPVFVETLGSWKLIAWEPDPTSDIDNDGMPTDNYLDEIDCYDNETMEFYSNGTGRMFLRSEANITYSPIAGTDEIEFSISCFDIEENVFFNWVQDGNSITLTLVDDTTLNYFRNGNMLFTIVEDGFFATSSIDNTSTITDTVTYIYEKL